MEACLVLGLLGVCSFEDIREKKIGIYKVCFTGIAGICLHILQGSRSIYSMLGGILLGAALVLFAKLSSGSIGTGDGLVLMATGVCLGAVQNFQMFLYSLFLAGLWALVLLLVFHRKRDYEIPFVPFLLLSYVGILLCS